MSFTEKIRTERGFSIYLISSDKGLKFYAYVLVPVAKEKGFEEAVNGGEYNVNDHGAVIDFCIGESKVPENIQSGLEKFLEGYAG